MAPVALTLAGCANIGDIEDECPGHGGRKSATLEYGDGYMTISPKRNVKQKSVLYIKLKASKDFRDKEVKTVGESIDPDDGTGPSKTWLDKTGSYADGKRIVYCVPPFDASVPREKSYVYKYSVHVDGVGMIDPRIGVTW